MRSELNNQFENINKIISITGLYLGAIKMLSFTVASPFHIYLPALCELKTNPIFLPSKSKKPKIMEIKRKMRSITNEIEDQIE